MLILALGCGSGVDDTAAPTCTPSVTQGSYGRVLWRQGNWAPDGDAGGGSEWPLATTVGAWSILADDAGAWFCNAFDDRGPCIVDVTDGTQTRFDIVIDYAAAY